MAKTLPLTPEQLDIDARQARRNAGRWWAATVTALLALTFVVSIAVKRPDAGLGFLIVVLVFLTTLCAYVYCRWDHVWQQTLRALLAREISTDTAEIAREEVLTTLPKITPPTKENP